MKAWIPGPDQFRAGWARASKLIAFGIVFVVLAAPAFGDTACTASSVLALAGTTCDIGNLQFSGWGIGTLDVSGNTIVAAPWSTSDFFFTPVPNGFTISFDGGPQSISALGSTTNVVTVIGYTVTVLGGYAISSESVAGGALSTSGFESVADYLGGTGSLDAVSSVGEEFVSQRGGSTVSFSFEHLVHPIFVGTGEVFPVQLGVSGDSTASWDGSPETFTYTEVFVPEPAFSLLLIFGLIALGGLSLLKHPKLN